MLTDSIFVFFAVFFACKESSLRSYFICRLHDFKRVIKFADCSDDSNDTISGRVNKNVEFTEFNELVYRKPTNSEHSKAAT